MHANAVNNTSAVGTLRAWHVYYVILQCLFMREVRLQSKSVFAGRLGGVIVSLAGTQQSFFRERLEERRFQISQIN